jgi:Leucine-rich repeat (LRR) protein
LQSLQRFEEAKKAFAAAVGYDPDVPGGKTNLDLTTALLAGMGPDGKPSPAQLRQLQQAMLEQNRTDEAFAMLQQISSDRETFRRTILDSFAKLGLRDRTEPNDDGTISLDLSRLDLEKGFGRPGGSGRRRGLDSLRALRNRPISMLNLDGTRLVDLTVLQGWSLRNLSINNNPILDFGPLAGMPLRTLSADGSVVRELGPLAGMKLESLRLRNTRVASLKPLAGMPLEQLTLAGCRAVTDLAPLAGAPLQKLDLSRTGISDLAPLKESPIRELNLDGCTDLIDLHPLMEMKQLDAAIIPVQCKDIAFLREHPSLKRLSYKKLTQPVYEFWQEFDAELKK